MKRNILWGILASIMLVSSCSTNSDKEAVTGRFVDYVNPFLGTVTLWDSIDLGYTPTRRTWGAEVFPGTSLPNAMVQVSPMTEFRSGAGYQYEDSIIYGFSHTNKGHWNLCHLPILPVSGEINYKEYYSPFNHNNESASPGYYQVYLEKYGINAELTSTLRCAFHRYTYEEESEAKKLLVDISSSNERIIDYKINKIDDHTFVGYQQNSEKLYFYATSNHKIAKLDSINNGEKVLSELSFENQNNTPLELKIGFSFVSIDKAKENYKKEILEKTFDRVRTEAADTWEALLSKIKISGGTEKQQKIFYSSLYRSFLWPALRSDVDQEYIDINGNNVNNGFHYYTNPSFWDDYRNKLILLGILSPKVATDVINSLIDKGEKKGFMPTFFHGDHASTFITGSYLRGLRDFDVQKAYNLILKNAMEENPSRPHILKYIELGYVPEQDMKSPKLETVANAAVTKTQEYAYDDYAVALLAKELGDNTNYEKLMKRTSNYKNVFDPSTGHMRGKLENGEWIKDFDPQVPFYEYMYREANAWQSTFFAPHDPQGLIELFGSKENFESKLDSLFTIPWRGYEAHNMSGFIGQYCHGNQPDHNFPHLYYFIDKPEKSQAMLDSCMNHFYGMGKYDLALCGMDDAGEMSSWYVLNAIGLYTFSPADPEYLVSVPLFDTVTLRLNDKEFRVVKTNNSRKLDKILYDGKPLNGFFISHDQILKGENIEVITKE